MNVRDHIRYGTEVEQALGNKLPVVALESTIISHGMPWPRNVETARAVEQVVRDNGATPATIAILDGKLKVGADDDDLERIGKRGSDALKVSRRDIAFALAEPGIVGSTTVAATMLIAERAGIRVFATGGIGGVHRGASQSFDISADLEELAKSSVAVVCAGAKSILDIGLTREFLETKGVPVVGYGTDWWPKFYSRGNEHRVDYRFDDVAAIANAMFIKWRIPVAGGMLVCAPIPEEYAIADDVVEAAIVRALEKSEAAGIAGKDSTPFLLKEIATITGGESLRANIELVLNNARVASQLSVAYRARTVETA